MIHSLVRIVVHTGNSFDWHVVEGMIEALAKVKIVNGVDVHFITVGQKGTAASN